MKAGEELFAIGSYTGLDGATAMNTGGNIYLYSQNANCMALYWTGLPPGMCLRLD